MSVSGDEGRRRRRLRLLLMVGFLLLVPHRALGFFLGDTKAVLDGCEDHWTLQDGVSMPLLLHMTVCVDLRVVVPGAWVAFSYSSFYAPGHSRPELVLEGDQEAIYGWLLTVRHRFPLRLSPGLWHRLCLRRDVPGNSLSLQVDGRLIADRTVIANAIPPSGSLWLGCHPRHRPPGPRLAVVELYMFRVWADLEDHGLCEDGSVIGWNSRSWGVTSPRARARDFHLMCEKKRLRRGAGDYRGVTNAATPQFGRGHGLTSNTSPANQIPPPFLTNPNPPGRSPTSGAPLVNCDTSKLCSNESAYFWMPISVEVNEQRKTETDVQNMVSKAFACHSDSGDAAHPETRFMDFCQGDRQLQVMGVSCSEKTNISQTNCGALLLLSPAVSACDLQQAGSSALQRAGDGVQARITGEVERVGKNLCEGATPPPGWFVRCTSSSSLIHICQSGQSSQVDCSLVELHSLPPPAGPEASCSRGHRPSSSSFCDCSAFCSSASHFYSVRISIQNSSVNVDTLQELLLKNRTDPRCNTQSQCRHLDILKLYQGVHLECHGIQDKLYSCMVILEISGPVHDCSLYESVRQRLSLTSITIESPLTRIMVCGRPGLSIRSLLVSNLTWVQSDLLTSDVCQLDPTLLECKGNETLAVLMTDSCSSESPMTTPPTVTLSTGTISVTPEFPRSPVTGGQSHTTAGTTAQNTATRPNITSAHTTISSSQSSTEQPVLQTVAVSNITTVQTTTLSDSAVMATASEATTQPNSNTLQSTMTAAAMTNNTTYTTVKGTTLSNNVTTHERTQYFDQTEHSSTSLKQSLINITYNVKTVTHLPNETRNNVTTVTHLPTNTIYNVTTVGPFPNDTRYNVTLVAHSPNDTTNNETTDTHSRNVTNNVTTATHSPINITHNATTVTHSTNNTTSSMTTASYSPNKTNNIPTVTHSPNSTTANVTTVPDSLEDTRHNITTVIHSPTTKTYNVTTVRPFPNDTRYNVTTVKHSPNDTTNNETTDTHFRNETNNITTVTYSQINTTHNITTDTHSPHNKTHIVPTATHSRNNTTHNVTTVTHSQNNTTHNVTTVTHSQNNTTYNMTTAIYSPNETNNTTTVTHSPNSTTANVTIVPHSLNDTRHNITTVTHYPHNKTHNVPTATHSLNNTTHNVTTVRHFPNDIRYNVTTVTHFPTVTRNNITTVTYNPNNTTHNVATVTDSLDQITNNTTSATGSPKNTAKPNVTTVTRSPSQFPNNTTPRLTTVKQSPNVTAHSVTTVASSPNSTSGNMTTVRVSPNVTTHSLNTVTLSPHNTTYKVTTVIHSLSNTTAHNVTKVTPFYDVISEHNLTTVTHVPNDTTAVKDVTTVTPFSSHTPKYNATPTEALTPRTNHRTMQDVTTATDNGTRHNVSTKARAFTASPDHLTVHNKTLSHNFTTDTPFVTSPNYTTTYNTSVEETNSAVTTRNTTTSLITTLNHTNVTTVTQNSDTVDHLTVAPNTKTHQRTTAPSTVSTQNNLTHRLTTGPLDNQSAEHTTGSVTSFTKVTGSSTATREPGTNSTTPAGTPPTATSTHSPTQLNTETTSTTPQNITTINTVTGTGIPLTTISEAAHEEQANNLMEQTQNASQLNSTQMSQMVGELEKLLGGPSVSTSVGQKALNIISNLMDGHSAALSTSANRLIRQMDNLGLKLTVEEREILSSGSLLLAVNKVDGTNFPATYVEIVNTDEVQLQVLSRSRWTRSQFALASVFLPSPLTAGLSPEQQQQASRVQFTFYTTSVLFQDVTLDDQTIVSPVLGCSVANLSISNLTENIEFSMRNITHTKGNFSVSCVFWDFTFNDGDGGWSSDGCYLINASAEEAICSCNHLTSFAILLDLSRPDVIDRQNAQVLTFITFIGCGISAVFLAMTLLTYLSFEKLLRDIPAKILVQLCFSLLFLNLVFLLDGWLALYPAVGLCISTAFFLHYFLLTSFTWAGLEALHMYLSIVRVFTPYLGRYMLKFSLMGWGIPCVVVIIVISVDKDNYGLVTYGRDTDGSTDDFCWLRSDIAFYVGVVAYFLLVFVLCLVVFVVVMVQLSRIKKQNPHNQSPNRGLITDLRSIAGLMVLLGLTWGFALFAWGPLHLPFVYLFSIFNSLQGFFIFVFHCAVKKTVRKQWRTYLCCGKLRLAKNSEWSRTATQKNRNPSLRAPAASPPPFTSRSSSVISDVTNSSGSAFADSGISDLSTSDVVLNEIHRRTLETTET